MNKKDTSEDSWQVLVDIYRRMPINIKAMRLFQAYQTGRTLAMAGLRESHPDATEKQIWLLWAKQHLGEKLFKQAYGAVTDG